MAIPNYPSPKVMRIRPKKLVLASLLFKIKNHLIIIIKDIIINITYIIFNFKIYRKYNYILKIF